MADTLDTGATKLLKVNGRDPFADETISEDSAGAIISIAAAAADGTVTVTGVADGTATITVTPGSEDAGFTEGSDAVTVSTPVVPVPLTVSLA